MNAEEGIDEIADRAKHVLEQAGVPAAFRLEPIAGGGNNRVYRVESAAAAVVLKAYFRHPDDPRDRLRAEFGFSSFAWNVGARALPEPLASDHQAGLAVYEFIAGRKVAVDEVTGAHVAEAAAFFAAVNDHRSDARAVSLPDASEACFSIAAHVACVDRRIERLKGIEVSSALGRAAADAVDSGIRPAWQRVRGEVLAAAGPAVDVPLPALQRCLSPSDFGFHNAILADDGRLRFLDFEYAGRDDPAKMACDFFCQPAVPVPREHLPAFCEHVAAHASDEPDSVVRRTKLLLPLYEVKWCCILLNEFLPVGGLRRSFARGSATGEARAAGQLAKAIEAMDRIGG